jgi:hypothetical protein
MSAEAVYEPSEFDASLDELNRAFGELYDQASANSVAFMKAQLFVSSSNSRVNDSRSVHIRMFHGPTTNDHMELTRSPLGDSVTMVTQAPIDPEGPLNRVKRTTDTVSIGALPNVSRKTVVGVIDGNRNFIVDEEASESQPDELSFASVDVLQEVTQRIRDVQEMGRPRKPRLVQVLGSMGILGKK